MSYTALYRKYRPNNFKNVIGQDIIVDVLKNSIISGHISHAYLFCGPRGTGKTSVAKIFAHAVNCLNFTDDICDSCENCIFLKENDSDIIEIDAASNNGVEEIRTIRDNVKLLPSFCKYKIYIIDEVHMLSTGAFNALLKTLEEPPSHVIFILATTEPNKIPLTILSRCQRFDFNKVDSDTLYARLKYILKCEEKVLPDDVLKYISENVDGGVRDAINLVDQVLSINDENISIEDVDKLSGKVTKDLIFKIFDLIIDSDYTGLLQITNKISLEGKNYSDVINNLLILLRDIEINYKVNDYFDVLYSNKLSTYQLSSNEIVNLSKILNELVNEIKNSADPKLLFEIYIMHLIEVIHNNQENRDNCSHRNIIFNEKIEINPQVVENSKINLNEKSSENDIDFVGNEGNLECNILKLKEIRINNVMFGADKNILNKVLKEYDQVNDYISNKIYNSVAALLLEGTIVVASDEYLLFTFLDDSYISVFDSNYKQIEIFLNDIFDHTYKVVAVTTSKWKKIREQFIFNKKNNISYVFIDENSVELEVSNNLGKLESSALSIFGEDTISVK